MHELALLESVPTNLFIGGEWRGADSGDRFVVDDPATKKPLAEVADAGAAETQQCWAATFTGSTSVGSSLRRQLDDGASTRTPSSSSQVSFTTSAEVAGWTSPNVRGWQDSVHPSDLAPTLSANPLSACLPGCLVSRPQGAHSLGEPARPFDPEGG